MSAIAPRPYDSGGRFERPAVAKQYDVGSAWSAGRRRPVAVVHGWAPTLSVQQRSKVGDEKTRVARYCRSYDPTKRLMETSTTVSEINRCTDDLSTGSASDIVRT